MAIFVLDLVQPQPNLNGNTKQSLVKQLSDLSSALRETEARMRSCSDNWHGRNFLPQGSQEARLIRDLAEGAWRLRMECMDTMIKEVADLAVRIQQGLLPAYCEGGGGDDPTTH